MLKKIGISILLALVLLVGVVVFVTKSDEHQLEKLKTYIGKPVNCPPAIIKAGTLLDIVEKTKKDCTLKSKVPADLEIAFYIARSYYPELNSLFIDVRYADIPTTMQTQPKLKYIFSGSRKYEIAINNKPDKDGIPIVDLPFNAQIGIFAHELAHILDYEHKNVLQLIGTGLRFTKSKSQESYEKSIDMLTIYKGLGNQLHAWAKYAMLESSASQAYKQFKKDIYLEPEEIQFIMKNNPTYCYYSDLTSAK